MTPDISDIESQVADAQRDFSAVNSPGQSAPAVEDVRAPVKQTWAGYLRAQPDLLLLAAVVVFGLALRLYNLGSFPDTLLADEADNAQAAIRILHGQMPPNGFFGFDWTAQPAYSVYLLSGSVALFGVNIAAIRLPSALLGALALIPFYFLLRRQFSTATATLATFLLATNVWYLNFTRSGWNNAYTCFYMLMAMLSLMLALDRIANPHRVRSGPWPYFGLAGLFCALGLYGYPSGRAISLGLAVFLPIAACFYRRHWKRLLLGYMLIGGVAIALFAPQVAYIVQNWDWFNGRTGTVALVNNPAFKADPLATSWTQIQRNARGPWDGSVNNTAQYTPVGEPQLDPPTGWLALAGFLLSLAVPGFRRRPETWLWWVMLLTAWVMTQLLTVGTPNGARGVIYLPALIYFAAMTLKAALILADRVRKRLGTLRLVYQVSVAVVTVLVLIVGFANVDHYRSWQLSPRTRQDRWEYATAEEFPAWTAWVATVADNKQGVTNLGQWHAIHPIPDPSVPHPATSAPVLAQPTPATP
jgi:4-amino-4-deoxy-L-arabinose transferase-like glycosyltransferase